MIEDIFLLLEKVEKKVNLLDVDQSIKGEVKGYLSRIISILLTSF